MDIGIYEYIFIKYHCPVRSMYVYSGAGGPGLALLSSSLVSGAAGFKKSQLALPAFHISALFIVVACGAWRDCRSLNACRLDVLTLNYLYARQAKRVRPEAAPRWGPCGRVVGNGLIVVHSRPRGRGNWKSGGAPAL